VGIAPALGYLRARTGNLLLAVLLAALPLTLAMLEPRDVLQRQQALIDYVHREFPARVNYLDYSGMIADYPRILKHLTSGNGIRGYYHRGDPIVARMINEGHVPFIIANYPVIRVALEGRRLPQTFLPPDIAAMKGNYVRQWGPLWREGAHVPAGAPDFTFNLSRGGVFVLDGDWLTIDGVAVPHGARISLKQGDHRVTGGRTGPSTLWRGDKLPGIPPPLTQGEFFTEF
jgi:hypothetical protein